MVRKPKAHGEIFTHGVDFIRLMFPRAKFIFHWRENISRIAHSDFWNFEDAQSAAQEKFTRIIERFRRYAAENPEHAYATTLEGVTDQKNQTQLEGLFNFLGETLTPQLRKMAHNRGVLKDWSEEHHTRRIKKVLENGTVMVDTVQYAWRPDEVQANRKKRLAMTNTTPDVSAL